MFIYNYIKQLNGIRYFSNNATLLAKNHYDTLGITPKATQADIKTAYYKMSMLYHPDKNVQSADAPAKFREVTDAYEVLSNVHSRRLYDKGITRHHTVGETVRRKEAVYRPPPPSGKTPIYDFDEWSRAHYEYTFAKDMAIKHAVKMRAEREQRLKDEVSSEKLGLILLLMLFVVTFYTRDDYDAGRNVNESDAPSKIPRD